jgi:hypothetical protein
MHLKLLKSLPSTQYYVGHKIDNEVGGAFSMYWDERGTYEVLVRKPEGETTGEAQAYMGG